MSEAGDHDGYEVFTANDSDPMVRMVRMVVSDDERTRMADELDLLRVQLDITTRLLREVWAYGNMSPLDGGTMNRIGNYLGLNE